MYKNNRGSVTVETTIILPIFIFYVLALFHMARLRMAESIIYEGAIDTAEYMAEFSYLEESDVLIARAKFKEYVDDKSLIDSYITDGIEGVTFENTVYLDEEGYVCLCVNYQVKIDIPLISELTGERSYIVRQRAYLGESKDQEGEQINQDDMYVYITDNREVYHISRSCSHLTLSISITEEAKADKMGYAACEFCGDDVDGAVLITEWGKRYHSKKECSGLKRSVYRVKKSQVKDLGACERCGG